MKRIGFGKWGMKQWPTPEQIALVNDVMKNGEGDSSRPTSDQVFGGRQAINALRKSTSVKQHRPKHLSRSAGLVQSAQGSSEGKLSARPYSQATCSFTC